MRGLKRTLAIFVVLTVFVGVALTMVPSYAGSTVGDFELDGNLTDSSPGAPYDWDTLPGAVVFKDPDPSPALTGCPAGVDDTFGGSSVEESPGGWLFVCKSVPQKDDFLEGGIGTRKIGSSMWLYLYFIRKSDTGSAALNYEFNQSTETFDNDGDASTPEVPVRTPGDLLINLLVDNGGQNTVVDAYTWSGSQTSGKWNLVVNGTPVKGTDWDVATNADAQDRFTFAELALNLEAFGITPTCPGFGKAWIKSNSTFDFTNGVLKDHSVRKDVNLSTCAIKYWEFTVTPQGIAGTTVVAFYTVGSGADAENRELTLSDPDGDGVYTGTDNQIPPGIVTFHFEVQDAGGNVIWSTPIGNETLAEGVPKTNKGSLNYDLTLSPDTAENFAGDSHTFTAHVFETTTNAPLPHVPVNFALANGTPAGCGSLSVAAGVTDAGGNVSTTVSSATPCTTDVVAWINGTGTGGTSGFDADEAGDVSTKHFVVYALSVTPGGVTNETGDPHTFTVLLTKNDGSGPQPLANALVNLSLIAPATSDAHFTQINGQLASGTTATCTTRTDDPATSADETGTCSVTLVATTPGQVTLHASYTATDSDGNTKIVEGDADKQFSAFAIDVTPDEVSNDAGSDLTHIFTVTLTKDEGSGFAPYPGQTVTVSLSPGTTGAVITAIQPSGVIGNPPVTGSCVTDAAGQCTVTITATSPGTATLTATWSGTLTGGGSVTRTDTATKHFEDFILDVTPDQAGNDAATDLTHTFEITLTRDQGSGFAPYPGQTVTVSLAPGTTGSVITAIQPSGVIGNPPVTGSCVTDAAGQCTVTITATSPGTATLTATWSGTLIGGGSVTRTDTATKHFEDFNLDVTPDEATNDAHTDLTHVFIVTLTRNQGSGFAPYPDQTVTVSLAPGTTESVITAIQPSGVIGNPPVTGSCVTDAAGQCTVTITATSPGTATLTATWSGTLTGGGSVTRTDTATKHFLDFNLTITPPTATNLVGDPHTFTVHLTKDDGTGTTGVANAVIHLVLDPGPTDAHFTSINGGSPDSATASDCTTSADDPSTAADEAGYCIVQIVASTPGTVTLTATWNQTIGDVTFTRTAHATKTYLDITVTKTSCPVNASPAGGIVDYAIAFSVQGSGLTNASVVDDLPGSVEFVSASPIGGVTPVTPAPGDSDGTVTWSFPTLAEGAYSGTIRVRLHDDLALGTIIPNTVTLDADEIGPQKADHSIEVTDFGRAADGRAFGLNVSLLGSEVIAPTPDSNETNPGELLSIPDPFGSATPLVKVLSVSESDDSTDSAAAYSATATAVGVDVNIPDVLHIKASSVVAKAASQATVEGASSSRAGSLIQDLWINGHTYGSLSEPLTVKVRDPLSGEVLAEIHLLETTGSGATVGQPQPDAGLMNSGIAVNGIHVMVHLLDLADVVVSHAEASAAFPSGLGCGGAMDAVSGSAYPVGVHLAPDSEGGIDLGFVKLGQVSLPITGGKDDATLVNVDVPGVVQASVADAHTSGETTDIDGDGVPVEATSESHIADADLLDGAIKATLVKATSHSEVGSEPSGSATIAHLELGGTDICEALGLDSICTPEPNTEFLVPGGPIIVMLNEQIPEAGGLTVNAVHIWILGKDNPLGLPVGVEVILANAHSDAHQAGEVGETGTTTLTTPAVINVKALSTPSAKRLRAIKRPVGYTLPAPHVLQNVKPPQVSVPQILQDPTTVVDKLDELPVADEVIDDAKDLIAKLADPEVLLQALADPGALLEGIEDPAAVVDAIAQAVGVADEPVQSEAGTVPTAAERLAAKLKQLEGAA